MRLGVEGVIRIAVLVGVWGFSRCIFSRLMFSLGCRENEGEENK